MEGMYISVLISDGWGNQMFKVAAMLAYAERHAHIPVFRTVPQKSNDHAKSSIDLCDQFPTIRVLTEQEDKECNWTILKERPEHCFTFNELPFVAGHVFLDGYFQSWKYLPRTSIPMPAQSMADLFERGHELTVNNWSNTYFLHVRRGDYLHPANAHHQIDLFSYMRQAFTKFSREAVCFVASDDIQWCQQELPRQFTANWLFCPEHLTDCETLHWMTLCGLGGICANSTFSWWAAYYLRQQFGSSVTVCMPADWGKPPLPPARDIHPSWCIKIF
jgi:hypothetical protein